MKLIRQSCEIMEQSSGLDGVYKQIELAGRTCYKSEDRITEDSAKKFIDMLINSGHGAMLEHGTVYLQASTEQILTQGGDVDYINPLAKYEYNKYSDVIKGSIEGKNNYFVTTNYRVLIENNWLDDLKYFCEPTKYHEKRISVRFIMDRIGSQSFTRHRVFSFAQESTRYCNYSKVKFGEEIAFIIPIHLELKEGNYEYVCETNALGSDYHWNPEIPYNILRSGKTFLDSLIHAETAYMELIGKWDARVLDKRYRTGFKGNPWTPQQARQVLPNALKTELVMTGTIEQWKGFFKLRCASNAHPDAQYLAKKLQDKFVERGYIDSTEVIK